MRYVIRDDEGIITAVFAEPQADAEPVPTQDPELVAFLAGGDSQLALRSFLASTDSELLRIVEDLVNVLIDQNVILLTDFPEPAQSKLLHRQSIRRKLLSY